MREVVIAGYLRTAQTRSRPKDPARDWFHKIRSDELLAKLLPELIKRTGIDAREIDDFLVGSAMGVNEQWSYGGRNIIFLANLPETIPAKFVDQQCGSAMAGIHTGFMEIATGFADIVMVGGMEHMTRVPMGGSLIEKGAIAPNMRLFTDEAYAHWEMGVAMNMGLTAEKLFAQTEFTREDMDKWGVRSHELAVRAREEGFFDGEILPIEAEQADGSTMIVDTDQAVRSGATLESMAELKPVVQTGGRRDHAGEFLAAERRGHVDAAHVQGNGPQKGHPSPGDDPFHRFCGGGSFDHGRRSRAGQQKGP